MEVEGLISILPVHPSLSHMAVGKDFTAHIKLPDLSALTWKWGQSLKQM